MNQCEPLQVLLDNSVMSYGLVAHGVTIPQEGWVNRLFLIQAKPARSAQEKWLREQIEALPTVARLAREGKIRLHTYSELRTEAWRRPGSFPSDPFGNVFGDVEIHEIPPAVERSIFFQQEMATFVQNESFAKFCQWLLKGYSSAWLDAPYVKGLITEQQIRNLHGIERYRELCKSLALKHCTDAFHLWTGETSGLTHFVSLDAKFIRAMMNVKDRPLHCVPVLPTDLLDQLGVFKRDPLPFEYGARYLLSGRRYD